MHSEHLRELLKTERYDVSLLAEKLKISASSVRNKLDGRNDWKSSEIKILVDLLKIEPKKIAFYFFD